MSPAITRNEAAGRCVVRSGSAGPKRWAQFLIAGLLGGLVATGQAAAVAGSDSDSDAAAVVRHSTGKSGGRLTWLPQRPDSAQDENAVMAAQYIAPLAPPRPMRMAQSPNPASSALSDPFGDKKKLTPAPAEMLSTMPAEPKADGSLPAITSEPPAAIPTPALPPADQPRGEANSRERALEAIPDGAGVLRRRSAISRRNVRRRKTSRRWPTYRLTSRRRRASCRTIAPWVKPSSSHGPSLH